MIALGTTVVRALEHAAARPGGCAPAPAWPTTHRRDHAHARLRAIVSGTHEPGSSHRELLRAFASDACSRTPTRRCWRTRL